MVVEIPVDVRIERLATSYGVDPQLALKIARCESKLVPQQSHYPDPSGPNGREDSWGIWQINLPSHPTVTREQAMDVEWSTNWAMKHLKDHPHMWSCYQ